MIMPLARFPKSAATLALAVCAALSLDPGRIPERPSKTPARATFRQVRSLRVERPRLGRRGVRYAPDRVLVRFRPEVSGEYARGLLRSYGF
ncbi:MAG TPA: hypothetical protein ENO03_03855, partial [Candidatus Aminicenantes bacterium]|nr:hypothetical protein [Candidatus Aminicenantes bacterium]